MPPFLRYEIHNIFVRSNLFGGRSLKMINFFASVPRRKREIFPLTSDFFGRKSNKFKNNSAFGGADIPILKCALPTSRVSIYKK